jgi:ribosomal protein L14E/L6E/L27E
MNFERAQIVRSRKGRDAGKLLCVMDVQEGFLLLADGKERRVCAPKRKNVKHVEPLGSMEHPTIEKVRTGQPVRDKQLRQLLAVFRDEMEV